jgi:peptide/nickel transport system substrate-binding protein
LSKRRTQRLLAVAVGLSLVAAACGDDDDDEATGAEGTEAPEATSAPAATEAPAASEAPAGSEPEGTEAPAGTEGTEAPGTEGTEGSAPASGETAMTVTYDINPDAVWDDGTPITFADFECAYKANLNTPGAIYTTGYDKITSITQGDSDKQVVVEFSEVYAPYKDLFRAMLKADAVDNCEDVSAQFADELPFSARPYKIDSWSLDQVVMSANENYFGEDTPVTPSVVMVPKADQDTEVASLLSGESDFIFPQAFAGLEDAFASEATIQNTPGYGTNYEVLHFQQHEGPLADPDFRAAFAKSIDRGLILQNIYDPIFPGGELLNCGTWVPTIGPWCDQTAFGNEDGTDAVFDPAGAEQILTDAGWEKDGSGMWAKDGVVPEIRWMVVAGNTRRESTQALVIPELQAAGFNVVADNCDAACNFQQRLPGLDYDMAMYISTAPPDPTVTANSSCAQVPSEENNFQGQNYDGWCNEEASDLMVQSDQELDETTRADQIHQIAHMMADDHVLLPLFQFPNIAAWRTDKVDGPIDQDASNYMAFQNIWAWQDVDGDGQIVIGAEQWPECLNPVTECANSSWMQWTTMLKVLPNAFDTTPDGTYEPSEVLAGEPVVEVAGG